MVKNNKKLILAVLMLGMATQPLNAGLWSSATDFCGRNWGKIAVAVGVLCLGVLWLKRKETAKKLALRGQKSIPYYFLDKQTYKKHMLGYSFLNGDRKLSDSEYRGFEIMAKKVKLSKDQDYVDFLSLAIVLVNKKPKMLKDIKKIIENNLLTSEHKDRKNFLKECIKVNNYDLVKFFLPFVLSKKEFVFSQKKNNLVIDDLVDYAKNNKAADSLKVLINYRKDALSLRGNIKKLKEKSHDPIAFPYEIIREIGSY